MTNYITMRQFGKALGISQNAVWKNCMSGYVPAFRISRYWMIDESIVRKMHLVPHGRVMWLEWKDENHEKEIAEFNPNTAIDSSESSNG